MYGDVTWGDEHTIQYTDGILQNSTPEAYITFHGHEQWWGDCLWWRQVLGGRGKGGNTGTTVIA